MLSLDEVRASMKRLQMRSEKLVGQLRKDASALVARAQVMSLETARRRAGEAVHELEEQRTKLSAVVRERLAMVVTALRGILGAASVAEVAALARRVSQLEHHPREAEEIARLQERLAQVEQRLETLTRAA